MVTYIYVPSGFITRISDRNPGNFFEKGAKNLKCVDCCSPMHFIGKSSRDKKKVLSKSESVKND